MTGASITIELAADVTLGADEVWPEGYEAPEVIDAAAVADLLKAGGNKLTVLRDWALLDGLRVTVTVDSWPEIGSHTTTTAEVWS